MAQVLNKPFKDATGKVNYYSGDDVNFPGDAQAAAPPSSSTPTRYVLSPDQKSYVDPESLVKAPDLGGAAPVSRYTDAAAQIFAPGGAAGALKPYTPEEEEKLRQTERTRVQAQIDAINEMSAAELASAKGRAEQRLGRNRALLSNTGQLGAPSGETQTENVTEVNSAEERAILASKADKINQIYGNVDARASDLIEKRKTLASTNANAYLDYLKESSSKALDDMKALATAQADLTPVQKTRLLEQTGYDSDTFETLYKSIRIANAPQDEYINKDKPEIVGNKAVYFKKVKDPKTGKITLVTETLDLPNVPKEKKVKLTVNTAEGVMVLYEDGTHERIGGVYAKPGTTAPGQTAADKKQTTDDIKSLATSLLTEKGKSAAVGRSLQKWVPDILSGALGQKKTPDGVFVGSDAADYITGYNQLKDMLALPNLQKLKGAMSDKDIMFLRNIGTRLSLDMGEEAFDRELNNVIARMGTLSPEAGGGDGGSSDAADGMVRMTGPAGEFDVPADQVDNFKENGYTEI